ncbi:hypothetical protein A0J48_010235 [Sphaerospermopsis aphanizomenoides BCCUSP55]|uniref:hypothetical protein n=1 Tax=Sphaerospermopsis aphanizomenoides TaxID=459663 RepID=UPI001907E453|nr:hypothetical protein [Sphaerospermopsis aphanizomenoides]MBK1987913.1 hypothetical protein [Sphaerospermopsis aphanizomenoides BCCUSP55]
MNNLIKKFSLTILVCFVSFACDKEKKTTEVTAVECPKQPKTILASNNVKTIDFSTPSITQSGMVSKNKSLGYTFEAKSGQKLGYSTNQDICIWIYTPDNQILSTPNLPTDGKYTIQISALKGSTTFDLTLSLDSVTAAATPTPISSPTLSTPVSNNALTTATTANASPTPSTVSSNPVSNNAWTTATSVSTPISSNSNTVYRPAPEKVIEGYYTKVNNHQYRDAWNVLPTALQEDKKLHPNGYNSFTDWWNKVEYVTVNQYSLEEVNNNWAVVSTKPRYRMKNGRTVTIPLKFYMSWNDANQQWEMVKFQKN